MTSKASVKGSRVLKVLKALKAHPLVGISNKEIADALNMSPVYVSRDLDDLIAEGLVQKLDNGRYGYSVQMLQIAERYRRDEERMRQRMDETRARVDTGSQF